MALDRLRKPVSALVLTAFLTPSWCAPKPPTTPSAKTVPGAATQKPALLFVTIDTWRWDHIGVSGSGKVNTPNMDRLAKGGAYDPEALTPYPLTTPSHASMFTGLNPLNHGVLDCMSYSLSKAVPTWPEAFRAAGYRTAAFVSGDTLKRRYGLTGGFETYDDQGMQTRFENDPMPSSRDGALTTKAALAWLKGLKGGDSALLWVHYFDLHTPYRSRPAYEAKYPKSRYAAQVAFVDDQVGQLVKALETDRTRSWRIVIVGDHGEGFGEHHEMGHGYGLYRETLSVPLILFPKPAKPLAQARPWGLIDLDPTIREWFSLPAGPSVDGRSLFRTGPPRNLESLSLLAALMFNVSPVFGVRAGPMMYMRHAREELYDLSSDPDEARDLSADPRRAKDAGTLRAACDAAFPAQRVQELLHPNLKSTQSELDSLRGLGYIEGSTPKLSEVQRVDLRQVLDDFNALQKAREVARKSGDTKTLKSTYDNFVKKYPRAASIYRAYGRLMLENRDYEAAFGAFDRAVRLNPNDPDSLLNLGTLYLQLKKNPKIAAVVLLERSVELSEAEPIAHLNLGIIYNDIFKDSKKAYPHFKRFLELDPQGSEAPKIRAAIKKMEAAGIR